TVLLFLGEVGHLLEGAVLAHGHNEHARPLAAIAVDTYDAHSIVICAHDVDVVRTVLTVAMGAAKARDNTLYEALLSGCETLSHQLTATTWVFPGRPGCRGH